MGKGSRPRRPLPAVTGIDAAQVRALLSRIPHQRMYRETHRTLAAATLPDALTALLVELSDPKYTALLDTSARYAQLGEPEFKQLEQDLIQAERTLRQLCEPLCTQVASLVDAPRAFGLESRKSDARRRSRAQTRAAHSRTAAATQQQTVASASGPLSTLARLIDGTLVVPETLPLAEIPFCSMARRPLFPVFQLTALSPDDRRSAAITRSTVLHLYQSGAIHPTTVGELRAALARGLCWSAPHPRWDMSQTVQLWPRVCARGAGRSVRLLEPEQIAIPLDLLAARVVAHAARP